MDTYRDTYVHRHIDRCIPTYLHTHILTCIKVCVGAHRRSDASVHTPTHVHVCMHASMWVYVLNIHKYVFGQIYVPKHPKP